jgi:hypothetical protein
MSLTTKARLKFPSGRSISIEVPSADLTASKSTKEIRAVLVLEQTLTLNTKKRKVTKSWYQKAVASRAKQTASVNQPKSCNKKAETLPSEQAKTTANVAISEFVKRSKKSYKTLTAAAAAVSFERVSPSTFIRNTPAGRGSTKELRDSKGNTYPNAAAAAAAYGISRWLIYYAISKRKGRLSKDLVIGYTGRLIPRWLYRSRVSGNTYASILSASKGEAISSGKIFLNLKQPEEQLKWEVIAVRQ